MHRREFTAAGLALIASAVCKAHASDYEILLGQLDLEVGHNEVLVQTGASQSALRLGKCAFLFAPFSSVKFNVGEGLAVKAANLMMGAMHSVFDPNCTLQYHYVFFFYFYSKNLNIALKHRP